MTNEGVSGDDAPRPREVRSREPTDLYELLEVSPHASRQVIRAAYRVLARNCHPDANAGHTDVEGQRRIRQLNAAYGVLNDAQLRAEYDLERARVRRHDRAIGVERGHVPMGVSTPVAATRTRTLSPAPIGRQSDDRFPVLRASAMLAVMVVTVFTLLALVLVWSTLDSGSDDSPAATQSIGNLRGR